MDQWGTVPVTDDNVLRLVRKAYQCAVGRPSRLDLTEAEDLAHDLSKQIGTNADISIDGDTLRNVYSQSLLLGKEEIPTLSQKQLQTMSKDEESKFRQRITDMVAGIIKDLDLKITSTLDVNMLAFYTDANGVMKFAPRQEPSTGLAKETIRQLNDIQETLAKIQTGWFQVGTKKPKDACYLGHYSFCGRETYVWVCPEGMAGLSEFTLAVLKLSSAVKDMQVVAIPSGIQFSPALTRPSR